MLRPILERQWLHVLLAFVLFAGVAFAQRLEGVAAGQLWMISTCAWMWLAVSAAVAHQVYVWFCWRTQLHASLLTRALGTRGFLAYAVVFSILGIARIVLVIIVAVSNQNSLHVSLPALRVLAAILALPAGYLFYSVARYFGFKRAFGIDHFEPSYRSLPMVRKGIFRYTRNGMYLFGFLALWIPALWFASAAAMVVAGFSHLYIWVHYYSTELPDMKRIYSRDCS